MIISRLTPHLLPDMAYIENTNFPTAFLDDLIDGIDVPQPDFQNIIIKNISKGFPDFMGTGSSELFVSERLRLFMEENIKAQQIKYKEVMFSKKRYFLVNIIGLRDCMDYEKSVYTTYKTNTLPHHIRKLVVREEKISPFDLFRMKDKPIHIFVTNKLKLRIIEEGFSGFEFIDNMNLTFG